MSLDNECSIELNNVFRDTTREGALDGNSVNAKLKAGYVLGGWERLRHSN